MRSNSRKVLGDYLFFVFAFSWSGPLLNFKATLILSLFSACAWDYCPASERVMCFLCVRVLSLLSIEEDVLGYTKKDDRRLRCAVVNSCVRVSVPAIVRIPTCPTEKEELY